MVAHVLVGAGKINTGEAIEGIVAVLGGDARLVLRADFGDVHHDRFAGSAIASGARLW